MLKQKMLEDFLKPPGYGNNTVGNFLNGELLEIKFDAPKEIDEIYCPVCRLVYPARNFYIFRRKGYNEKYSTYGRCRACAKRYQNMKASACNDFRGADKRIGIVSFDALFGLNLYVDELALMLEKLANDEKLTKVREAIEHKRRQKVGNGEIICKKTLMLACYRVIPIIYRYVVDVCRPKKIDRTLVMDTFHFTRMRHYLKYFPDEADYAVKRGYTQHSVTILIGSFTKGIFGFGFGEGEYKAAKRCVAMAMKYTSEHLPKCIIKFDGSDNERRALLEAGIPPEHLISVSKGECRSYINQCEGIIRALRGKGLGKRAYSLPLSMFLRTTISFVSWNLFTQHTLLDGRWNGKIADLISVEAPTDWNMLIEKSWKYILSKGDLFEKYYPRFGRGPKKIKHT